MKGYKGLTIAALYDIHGNLPALEAVLREPWVAAADVVMLGGDLILGPMPIDTLECLIALGSRARMIRGNCDRLIVDAYDGRSPQGLPLPVLETVEWVARQLRPQHRELLAALPMTDVVQTSNGREVLFCHATPRSDEENLTVRTSEVRAAEMFAGVRQPLVVCGHTHMQYDRVVRDIRIVNAGSVGMPFGSPGAYWLRLDAGIQLMRTEYDLDVAAARIRRTAYPDAAHFSARHVVAPPSEVEMLLAFGV